jgi:ubiquinone/menaquinone biosynthesis C-methylase UbiE
MSTAKLKERLARALFGPLHVGTRNLADREVWLEGALAQLPAGSRMLDAGAGETQYRRFCAHLQYTSQDFGQYDGKGNQVGIQAQRWDNSRIDIRSDITRIPVADASFDAVMCVEVLEHIPDPVAAIAEFARLLRPGGWLILTAPVASITHFAPYYFCNGFSRYFYEHVLPAHGFAITQLDYNGNWLSALAQELRRVEEVRQAYAPAAPAPSWLTRLAQKSVLRHLQRMDAHQRGLEELSAHGIHVIARRHDAPHAAASVPG